MQKMVTAKQLEEYLHVDRTTVYRMLKDGRLNGVKIGHHWRFNLQEVEDLLAGKINGGTSAPTLSPDILPLHCMQPVQDVFAEIAQVGAVTADNQGLPLTKISNCSSFCRLILETEQGRQACIQSWKKLAEQKKNAPEFTTCHAGLSYARARIMVKEELIAILVTGQFYPRSQDEKEEEGRIKGIAEKFNIDIETLKQAAKEIKVLDGRNVDQITGWLERVANTFEQISTERADLMGRLKQISSLSDL